MLRPQRNTPIATLFVIGLTALLAARETLAQSSIDLRETLRGTQEGARKFPETISWIDFSTAKLKELRSQNKPVLVFCRADWDATGKILERTLFKDKRVIGEIKRRMFVPLLADFILNKVQKELIVYL